MNQISISLEYGWGKLFCNQCFLIFLLGTRLRYQWKQILTPGGCHGKPTLVFLPGEFHGQRSLVGYNPQLAKSWTWLKRPSMCAQCWWKESIIRIEKLYLSQIEDYSLRDSLLGKSEELLHRSMVFTQLYTLSQQRASNKSAIHSFNISNKQTSE